MSFSINRLGASIAAGRELAAAQTAISGAVERLSSGLRINRAADDAAGLGISEQIRSQIKGLNQSARNANDLISMVQTADGSLNQVTDMLRRMRELATQARNASLSLDQKRAISREISQLREGINHVAERTAFNTNALLKNSLIAQNLHAAYNNTQLAEGREVLSGLVVRDLNVAGANEGDYSISFGSVSSIAGQRSRITTEIDGTTDSDNTQAITITGSGSSSASITLSGMYRPGDAIRFTVKGDNPDRTLVQTYVVTAENLTANNDGLSPNVSGDSLQALSHIAAGMAAQYNAANALTSGDVDLDNKFSKPDAVASGATVTFSGSYLGTPLTSVTAGGYVINRGSHSREIIPAQEDLAAGNRITVRINDIAYQYVVASDSTTESVAEGLRRLFARDYPIHATRAGSIVTLESDTDLGLADISYEVRKAVDADRVFSVSSSVSSPGGSPTATRTVTINDNDVIAGRKFTLDVANPDYLRTYTVIAGTDDNKVTIAEKFAALMDDHYGAGAAGVSASGGQVALGSATSLGMAKLSLTVQETVPGQANGTVGPARGITSAVWGVGGRLDDGQYEFFYNDAGNWVVVQDPVAGFTSTFNGSVLTTSPGNQVNVLLSASPKPGDRIFFDINNGDPERPIVRMLNASNSVSGILNDTQAVLGAGSLGVDSYSLQYNGSIWVPQTGATYSATYNTGTDVVTIIDNPRRTLSQTAFGNSYSYDGDRVTFSVSSGTPGNATFTRAVGVTYNSSSYAGGGAVTGGWYTLSFNGASWASTSGSFNGSTLQTSLGGDVNISLSGAKEGDSIQLYVDSGSGTVTSVGTRSNSFSSGVVRATSGSDPLVSGSYSFLKSGGSWGLVSGPAGATYDGSTIINGPVGSARVTKDVAVRRGDGLTQRDALSGDLLTVGFDGAAYTATYTREGVTGMTFAVAGGLGVGDYTLEYNGAISGNNYTVKNRFGDAVTTATYAAGRLTFAGGDRVDLVLTGTPKIGDKVYFTITGGNVITNRLIEGSNIGGRETSISSQTRDRSDRVITISPLDIRAGRSVALSIRGKEYAVLAEAGDTASSVATKLAGLLTADYPNTTSFNETTDFPMGTRISVSGNQITLQELAKLGLEEIGVSVREIRDPAVITIAAKSNTGLPGRSQSLSLGELGAGDTKTLNFDQLGIAFSLTNERSTSIGQDLFAAYVPQISSINISSANRSPMAQLGARASASEEVRLGGFGDIRLSGSNRNVAPIAESFDRLSSVIDELDTLSESKLVDDTFARVINFSDSVLTQVSTFQTQLGANHKRLEHAIAGIENTSINLQATQSRITDVDYASEMARLIRMQIGQQAASAMLAQGNLLPEVILSMLQATPG